MEKVEVYLGPNPKQKPQDNDYDNKQGSDEKEGALGYKTRDTASKCKVTHKGYRCLHTHVLCMGNRKNPRLEYISRRITFAQKKQIHKKVGLALHVQNYYTSTEKMVPRMNAFLKVFG